MPTWLIFHQGQTLVNLTHVVSAKVLGNEKRCQIRVVDITGHDYLGCFYTSFGAAERMITRIAELESDDNSPNLDMDNADEARRPFNPATW
jgi:hypothetical protein